MLHQNMVLIRVGVLTFTRLKYFYKFLLLPYIIKMIHILSEIGWAIVIICYECGFVMLL
jgi:hypothetical protein